MQLRSLEADKNEYDFTAYFKKYNFFSQCHNDHIYHLPNRLIISFIPSFAYDASASSNNKYHFIESFLHLLILV